MVGNVSETPGKGVTGTVDGHKVEVGRFAFVTEQSIASEEVHTAQEEERNEKAMEQADREAAKLWPTELEPDEMATYIAIDGKLAARIVLRDVPRYNAKQSIAQLRELGVKEETMLTGDKKASAMIIANEVGITDVRYELLPQDKVNAVREAAAAAKEIMDKGPYSLVTGDVKTAYRSLFTSAGLLTQEVIFGREYSKELSAFHETSWYYYSPTYGAKIAMTKKFMNTYLTTKGTPFTDIDGYKTIDFIHEFDGRDARMAQTVISPTYKMKISGRERLYSPNWKVTRTGYHPIKWSIDDDADNVLSKAASWNSLPILRYAEVLLNYAEAKAELGEMDAAVWDQTIAQLRSRAGVTPVVPDKADPYMEAYFLNTVTDKWILEVRRERGIELCLEMGLRWDDDMRWHMGDLLTSDNNPWTGIYIGSTSYTYDYTGLSTDDNGDPVPDFYIRPGEDTEHSIAISNTGANQTFSLNAAGNIVWEYKRTWGEKKYLRPIPQTAITRNPNLEQNALWK